MNETEVWKRSISFITENGGYIICGCPPGATSYMYKNCNLSTNNKNDSPDIIFMYKNDLFIAECKPNYTKLYLQNINNENDFSKLARMKKHALSGKYTQMLKNNYDIDLNLINDIKTCVCYAGTTSEKEPGHYEIVVSKTSVSSNFI